MRIYLKFNERDVIVRLFEMMVLLREFWVRIIWKLFLDESALLKAKSMASLMVVKELQSGMVQGFRVGSPTII